LYFTGIYILYETFHIWEDFCPKYKLVRRPLTRTHRPSGSLSFR